MHPSLVVPHPRLPRSGTIAFVLRWLCRAGVAALIFVAPFSARADALPDTTTQSLGASSHVLIDAAGADGAVNAGFVVTASSVVMVGAPGSAQAALRWLDAVRAVTPKPVSHLLLTGWRPEQAEGIAALKSRGASIVARRSAAPTALVADLWLDDSTDLLFGGVHIQALAFAPVHGPHDMAYSVEDEAVLYAGELLVTGRLPDVRDADAAHWIDALSALQKEGAKALVPEQGAVSLAPQTELQGLHDYLELLQRAMGEAARSRMPFDEAYDRGDWSRYAELPLFDTLNRANARHTYLQAQGQAQGQVPGPAQGAPD